MKLNSGDAHYCQGMKKVNNSFVQVVSAESADLESAAEEASVEDATEDYWTGSGSGPDEDENARNETRETLAHEASDHEAVSVVSLPLGDLDPPPPLAVDTYTFPRGDKLF